MNSWFRLYHTVLDDPKVQRLPDRLFKAWINLLCLGSRQGGQLPGTEDVGFALRVGASEAAKILEALAAAALLDREDDAFRIHNWDRRQFVSDGSTERVKRYRQRSGKRDGNGEVTLHATPPDSESDSDQNRTERRRGRPGGYEPPSAPPQADRAMTEEERARFLQRHAETIKRSGQKPYFVSAEDVAAMVEATLLTPEQAARCTG